MKYFALVLVTALVACSQPPTPAPVAGSVAMTNAPVGVVPTAELDIDKALRLAQISYTNAALLADNYITSGNANAATVSKLQTLSAQASTALDNANKFRTSVAVQFAETMINNLAASTPKGK